MRLQTWALQGFSSVYQPRRAGAVLFAELLDNVARACPEMRIRFTSPHPKDFGDDVLQARSPSPTAYLRKLPAHCVGDCFL